MLYRDLWMPTAVRVPLWRGAEGWRGKRSIHVLIVEDDGAIADMYQLQLEHDGYRVSVANTAQVGIDAIEATPPDIVLLDLLLPDRSGFELITMLKERLPTHPPIVILSNYGEPEMVARGLSLGALHYLVKSRVTPATVSRSIPGWLEGLRDRPKN